MRYRPYLFYFPCVSSTYHKHTIFHFSHSITVPFSRNFINSPGHIPPAIPNSIFTFPSFSFPELLASHFSFAVAFFQLYHDHAFPLMKLGVMPCINIFRCTSQLITRVISLPFIFPFPPFPLCFLPFSPPPPFPISLIFFPSAYRRGHRRPIYLSSTTCA